ncbi:MAG: DUF3850 domain-containing protein [Traorella sp.]
MTVHSKKTMQANFQDIADGIKTYDIRKDRCNYQVGDFIIFQEVLERDVMNAFSGRLDSIVEYTGRSIKAEITYKQKGGYGLKHNWCVLGLKLVK